MAKITDFLHVSILVSDLDRTRAFYEGMLGLTPSAKRPKMTFDGIWYDIGSAQIHVLVLPNPDQDSMRPEHGGRDRHIALGVEDWASVKLMFDQTGVAYTLSRSGRRALFCRDPDGNALELIEV